MFAYIKGILEYKGNSFVIVETLGVGYRIYMPQTSIERLAEIGENVKIYTYYYVREDNISLYGFNSNEELRMFELLLSVSGIGAKSAIAMISEINPSSFALAVISDDTQKLTKISGIGKKTAARIILELKDKIKTEETINNENIENKVTDEKENVLEAIAALQVLGYSRKEVDKILSNIDAKSLSVENIIKEALKYLGG